MSEFDLRKQSLNDPRAESVVWTLVERKNYGVVRGPLPDYRVGNATW